MGMAFNAYIGFSPIFAIVKSSRRIIIEHINHNPHGKDASDTGPGEDLFEEGKPSKSTLHWGRHAFVWNNEGDTATLFDAEGNKVDSLQVVTLKAT